jgi:hypothetical protein
MKSPRQPAERTPVERFSDPRQLDLFEPRCASVPAETRPQTETATQIARSRSE